MEILIHEILLFTASWIIRDIKMDSVIRIISGSLRDLNARVIAFFSLRWCKFPVESNRDKTEQKEFIEKPFKLYINFTYNYTIDEINTKKKKKLDESSPLCSPIQNDRFRGKKVLPDGRNESRVKSRNRVPSFLPSFLLSIVKCLSGERGGEARSRPLQRGMQITVRSTILTFLSRWLPAVKIWRRRDACPGWSSFRIPGSLPLPPRTPLWA